MKKLFVVLLACLLLASFAYAAPSIGGLTKPIPAVLTIGDGDEVVDTTVAMADETDYTGVMADTIHMANEGVTLRDVVETYIDSAAPAEVDELVRVTNILEVKTVTGITIDADSTITVAISGNAATQGLEASRLVVLLFKADQTIEFVKVTEYDPETGSFAFDIPGELCPFILTMYK